MLTTAWRAPGSAGQTQHIGLGPRMRCHIHRAPGHFVTKATALAEERRQTGLPSGRARTDSMAGEDLLRLHHFGSLRPRLGSNTVEKRNLHLPSRTARMEFSRPRPWLRTAVEAVGPSLDDVEQGMDMERQLVVM